MPAVKFSREFYQRLGDKLVNELVEVLNQVNAANRIDLREYMEAGFARLEAKFEQRTAELRADFIQRMSELRTELLQRIAEMGAHIEQRIEDRFEKRFGHVDARLDRLDKRLDQQNRLFILAWVTLMAAVVGLGMR